MIDITSLISSFGSSGTVATLATLEWDEILRVTAPAGTAFRQDVDAVSARTGRTVVLARQDEMIIRAVGTPEAASAIVAGNRESAAALLSVLDTMAPGHHATMTYSGTSLVTDVAPDTVPNGWGQV